jgi:hypothetical protein
MFIELVENVPFSYPSNSVFFFSSFCFSESAIEYAFSALIAACRSLFHFSSLCMRRTILTYIVTRVKDELRGKN